MLEQGGIEMNFCLSVISVLSPLRYESVTLWDAERSVLYRCMKKAPASVGMQRPDEFLEKLANREAEG